MAQLLEQLRVWIENIILSLHYPGIVLVMFVESVFPPIPSELVMPFAGFLVARGELSLLGVVLAGTLGSVLGAIVLYLVGWRVGDPVLRSFLRRYHRWLMTSEKDYERALKVFERYGVAAVCVGRVVPLVRSLISIPAGMERMPLGKFLLFSSIGASVWSGVMAVAGMLLQDRWDTVMMWVAQYEKVMLGGLLLAVGMWIFWRWSEWRKVLRTTEAGEYV